MAGQLQSIAAVNEMAALLIPVNGRQLVLPNVTVAEIISYTPPVEVKKKPAWFLGTIKWRSIDIPVVSFEMINKEKFTNQSNERRLIILNSLVDENTLPFCAFVAEGMPRLMRVMVNELANDEAIKPGPAEHSRVLVSGEVAAIPNVDFIQSEILKNL